jgi:Sec-independent protein translocase protein TatA
MVSLEPLLFVGVGALILVGPKELPVIAKAAGYYTGRAMALFLQARARYDTFSNDAEIKSVRMPLRDPGLATGVSEG